MLLISTYLASSPIHGIGVFVSEFVPKGTIIWQWHDGVDQRIPYERIAALPEKCQEEFKRHSWVEEDGYYYICIDNERFVNHSDEPTCVFPDCNTGVAARDLVPGEELTQDYSEFDVNFGLAEFGYDWLCSSAR